MLAILVSLTVVAKVLSDAWRDFGTAKHWVDREPSLDMAKAKETKGGSAGAGPGSELEQKLKLQRVNAFETTSTDDDSDVGLRRTNTPGDDPNANGYMSLIPREEAETSVDRLYAHDHAYGHAPDLPGHGAVGDTGDRRVIDSVDEATECANMSGGDVGDDGDKHSSAGGTAFGSR